MFAKDSIAEQDTTILLINKSVGDRYVQTILLQRRSNENNVRTISGYGLCKFNL